MPKSPKTPPQTDPHHAEYLTFLKKMTQDTLAPSSDLARRKGAWEKAGKREDAGYSKGLEESFGRWAKQVEGAISDKQRLDSWQNYYTGTGTSRDKVTQTFFSGDCQLSFGQLEDLYHHEDLAARIVNYIPGECWRAGYELKVDEDVKLGKELREEQRKLGFPVKAEYAQAMAQLYGGGGLFVGVGDGQKPDKPVKKERVKSIDFLQVFDRYSLWPNTWYIDEKEPKFGEPETYRVFAPRANGMANINTVIHESRLILFPGAPVSPRRRIQNFSWEDSILQRPYQVLLQFGLSWAAATHLLSDAAQAVYKIKNLLDMIASGNKDALLERMRIVDETRSSQRMVLVDADDEALERTPTPFTGIPEMLDRVSQRLSAATDIPVRKLMGTSQKGGLNGDGDTEQEEENKKIAAVQERVCSPAIERLTHLQLLARGKKDASVSIVHRPLAEPSAKEQAEERKLVADTDSLYFEMGLQGPIILRNRFGGDKYSAETQLEDGELEDIEAEAQAEKDAQDEMHAAEVEATANPPPPGAPGAKPAPFGAKPSPKKNAPPKGA